MRSSSSGWLASPCPPRHCTVSLRLPWWAKVVCGVSSRLNTPWRGGYWHRPSRKCPRVCSCTSSATESPAAVVYDSTPGWFGLSLPRFLAMAPKSAFRVMSSGSVASNKRSGARGGVESAGVWLADAPVATHTPTRSEEHTSELQSQSNLVCRLLLEKKKTVHI